jgi:hypothetical protein
MITLCIRYTLDISKLADFEDYARRFPEPIERCGGKLVGYYLPTKIAGPTNFALALINFPSLAAYEIYRDNLLADADAVEKRSPDGKIRVRFDRGPHDSAASAGKIVTQWQGRCHIHPCRIALSNRSRSLPGTRAVCANAKDAATSAAPSPQSAGCVRASQQTIAPLLPACARCRHPDQTAS